MKSSKCEGQESRETYKAGVLIPDGKRKAERSHFCVRTQYNEGPAKAETGGQRALRSESRRPRVVDRGDLDCLGERD